MKKLLTLLLSFNLLAATACTTFFIKDGKVNEERLNMVTAWAETAVTNMVKRNAKTETEKQSFLVVAESIDLIIDANEYSPEETLVIIQDYVIDRGYEDQLTLVMVGLENVLNIYTRFYEKNLSNNEDLSFYVFSRFLIAIQTGIRNSFDEELVRGVAELPETLAVIE